MRPSPRYKRMLDRRLVVGVILVAGMLASILAYRALRQFQRDQAEREFVRRAEVRHALTREVLDSYQDVLFGLQAMFATEGSVDRDHFTRLARQFVQHTQNVLAIEWVPVVAHRNRDTAEAAIPFSYGGRVFEFTEIRPGGATSRAAERPEHYPITLI